MRVRRIPRNWQQWWT
uniref:Truncated envelope glycoprotein n=1 Tax=Human immunodeficiency virus type 1 TaxID=11676 RepID=A0A0H3YD07_HV1|nr:truncated envelope glycoprotein [Human immunodeficiency virus 1]